MTFVLLISAFAHETGFETPQIPKRPKLVLRVCFAGGGGAAKILHISLRLPGYPPHLQRTAEWHLSWSFGLMTVIRVFGGQSRVETAQTMAVESNDETPRRKVEW